MLDSAALRALGDALPRRGRRAKGRAWPVAHRTSTICPPWAGNDPDIWPRVRVIPDRPPVSLTPRVQTVIDSRAQGALWKAVNWLRSYVHGMRSRPILSLLVVAFVAVWTLRVVVGASSAIDDVLDRVLWGLLIATAVVALVGSRRGED